MRRPHSSSVLAVAAVAACCANGSAQQKKAIEASPLEQFSESVQTLSRRVAPSVVQIQATSYRPREEEVDGRTSLVLGKQQSIGSGVIIDAEGYIVTNAHVVQGAERIRVSMLESAAQGSPERPDVVLTHTLAQPFTRSVEASLVGVFPEMDLALIKVQGSKLPVLPFADYSKLRQGQVVFAFGSREGLGNSVSMGVVSSIARQPDPDSPFIFIQTDAAINPGDSGGPLVNTAGEIVGLDTFIYSKSGGSEGIGFAIPSALIERVSSQLKAHGHIHRMVIGASLQTITPVLSRALGLARESGVLITDIFEGSPAAQAGLHLNDIVLSLDGTPIYNLPLFMATTLVHAENQPMKFEVLRRGATVAVEVEAKYESRTADKITDLINTDKSQIPELGIVGIAVDDRTSPLLPSLRSASGVYVVALAGGARMNPASLQAGDVIHEINGTLVTNPDELRTSLGRLAHGDPVALFIERDEKLLYVTFENE